MHFQLPPKATIKGVTCLSGAIFDVVVDLRVDSPTYKHHFSVELSRGEGEYALYSKGTGPWILHLKRGSISFIHVF